MANQISKELVEKLKAVKTPEERAALLKENGIGLPARGEDAALSDGELENLAGGERLIASGCRHAGGIGVPCPMVKELTQSEYCSVLESDNWQTCPGISPYLTIDNPGYKW
jgi:hypothetical protein